MPRQKLSIVWTKHFKDEKDKIKFIELLGNSSKVLDVLKNYLDHRYLEVDKVKKSDYDVPSWSHKQAHLNGYKDALRDIINLLTITKD